MLQKLYYLFINLFILYYGHNFEIMLDDCMLQNIYYLLSVIYLFIIIASKKQNNQ